MPNFEFSDWKFKSIKELVEAIDSGKFAIECNGGFVPTVRNNELYGGLQSGRIKPKIGNPEHIMIVEIDRRKYLWGKYYEYKEIATSELIL